MKDSKEEQLEIATKVLEEMGKAEEFMKEWNASWFEECSQACLLKNTWIPEQFKEYFEKRYFEQYKFYDMVPVLEGEPLRHATLFDYYGLKYDAIFGTVIWKDIRSKKASRNIIFKNNGDIILVRKPKGVKQKKRTSYRASFNVMQDGFNFNISNGVNVFIISDTQTSLYINYCGISIKVNKLNFDRSMSLTKTVDPQSNITASLDMTFDVDSDILKHMVFEVETHKNSDGKVNGIYRLTMSANDDKRVNAKFYSRNGLVEDLISGDEEFVRIINNSEGVDAQALIDRFLEVVASNIQEKNPNKMIVFGNLISFSTDKERYLEEEAVEMLKSLRGEIPLAGLVERIDQTLNALASVNTMKRERINESIVSD